MGRGEERLGQDIVYGNEFRVARAVVRCVCGVHSAAYDTVFVDEDTAYGCFVRGEGEFGLGLLLI